MLHLCSPILRLTLFCSLLVSIWLFETLGRSRIMQHLSSYDWFVSGLCVCDLFSILYWNIKNVPHPVFSRSIHHCCHGVASFHLSLTDNCNLFYENQNGHRGWNPGILCTIPQNSHDFIPHRRCPSEAPPKRVTKTFRPWGKIPPHVIFVVIICQGLWGRGRLFSSTSIHCVGWYDFSALWNGKCACMHATVVLVEYPTVYRAEKKKQ